MQGDRLHMSFYGRCSNSPGHTSSDTCFLEDWNRNTKYTLLKIRDEVLHSQTRKGQSTDLRLPKPKEFAMSQSRHLFKVGIKSLKAFLRCLTVKDGPDRQTHSRLENTRPQALVIAAAAMLCYGIPKDLASV